MGLDIQKRGKIFLSKELIAGVVYWQKREKKSLFLFLGSNKEVLG